MKIWTHRYFLPESGEGVLLRVEFTDVLFGVSCLHPWPQFGHGSLDENVRQILSGEPSYLFLTAMRAAQIDAESWYSKTPLFKDLSQIQSHTLLTKWNHVTETEVRQTSMVPVKKDLFKIKLSPQKVAEFFSWTDSLGEKCSNLIWRLDFNSSFTFEQCQKFLNQWKRIFGTTRNIDFIEDPTPFLIRDWSELKREFDVKLAIDHEFKNRPEHLLNHPVDVVVYKPASQDKITVLEYAQALGTKICVTHSLEHAVGRQFALYEALSLSQTHPDLLLPCGFNVAGDLSFSALSPYGFFDHGEMKKLKWDFLL